MGPPLELFGDPPDWRKARENTARTAIVTSKTASKGGTAPTQDQQAQLGAVCTKCTSVPTNTAHLINRTGTVGTRRK